MGTAAAGLAGAPRPTCPDDKGPIRIGYFRPLTGNFSQTGKDMTDGFSLFWEEVGNKVAGREVKVIEEDSDPEPTSALNKVRRLVEQEKVHTVADGRIAETSYAIAPYLERTRSPPSIP
jgi:branched-chain amino acid transport system substrate-binding protein